MISKHYIPKLKILQKLKAIKYSDGILSQRNGGEVNNSILSNTLKESKRIQFDDGFQSILKEPILWYNCGPTVYSDSHMGHARNYLTIDIIRRILEDYFKVSCHFVQNITDIDDKLIKAVGNWKITNVPNLGKHITGISDTQILSEIASHYEDLFWKDMKDLNVRKPNFVLRVTEHLDEIQEMISKLLKVGFAYIGKDTGSIYFNTEAYIREGRNYDQFNCCSNDTESELEWISEDLIGQKEKRSNRDFVLWKRDESVFGFSFSGHVKGRPGWHIECSAMSNSIFGSHIDIHSGGIDLQFPHHTNEIAQSCAYTGNSDWVQDWIHIGHLHIQGQKMSKSLKNFTTIQEGLKNYDKRVIRMMALQHHYSDSIDFSDNLMQNSIDTERFFREFFLKMDAMIRINSNKDEKPSKATISLFNELWKAEQLVQESLLQDFNTPKTLEILKDLIRQTHKYEQFGANKIDSNVLLRVTIFVTKMFETFGFTDDSIGYGRTITNDTSAKLMDTFTKFRKDIRNLARKTNHLEILEKCDDIRDNILPNIGIRLEDLPDGNGIWKFDDYENIKLSQQRDNHEKELKMKHAEEKRLKSEARAEISKIPPNEYFKILYSSEFSQYDQDGFPILDSNGEPLSKSQTKRLRKLLQRHLENYKE